MISSRSTKHKNNFITIMCSYNWKIDLNWAEGNSVRRVYYFQYRLGETYGTSPKSFSFRNNVWQKEFYKNKIRFFFIFNEIGMSHPGWLVTPHHGDSIKTDNTSPPIPWWDWENTHFSLITETLRSYKTNVITQMIQKLIKIKKKNNFWYFSVLLMQRCSIGLCITIIMNFARGNHGAVLSAHVLSASM